MRIGINARFLVAKRTGVQRAAYNLIKTLVQIDRENEYFLFTSESELGNPEWNYPNVHVVPSRIRGGESIRNHIWEQLILPRLAHKHRVDLLHSPANIAPLLYRGRSVVHIHDLCFVVNPQWYSFSFRTVYNFIIPRLAKRAAKVITNSNNSRNDLLQFCELSADKVSQVYWAVDDMFAAADAKSDSQWDLKDYILYVGSLEPRKNIKTLLEAYEMLRERNPKLKTKLVLIGGESNVFAEVRFNIKHFKEDVIFKGFVDDKVLRDFYRHATLFVYPSLYEGFGLPPLEAMASGAPVITSMTSSIPEVVGDAALLVSPNDAEEIANKMALVIESPELRASMVKKGFEQIEKFKWSRVARNTLIIYHEVVNNTTEQGRNRALERCYIPFDQWKKLATLDT